MTTCDLKGQKPGIYWRNGERMSVSTAPTNSKNWPILDAAFCRPFVVCSGLEGGAHPHAPQHTLSLCGTENSCPSANVKAECQQTTRGSLHSQRGCTDLYKQVFIARPLTHKPSKTPRKSLRGAGFRGVHTFPVSERGYQKQSTCRFHLKDGNTLGEGSQVHSGTQVYLFKRDLVIPQGSAFHHTSIRENLLFGNKGAGRRLFLL